MPRPTMKDVADHLGVSRQLVSLALRDLPGASAETRERVRSAASELGYYPDESARLLRGHRSFQLGVVFTMRQPFEVDLVEALLSASRAEGFSLVLGPLTADRPQTQVVGELLGQRIEALLVLATDGGGPVLDDLPPRIPVVQVGGPQSGKAVDDVRVDSALGVRTLVDHLVGLGHRRITHVTGGDGPNAGERLASYVAAMEAAGLGALVDVVPSEYTEEAGARAAATLLARDVLPTAIIAGNDRAAVGVLETLVRSDVSVPRDVSLVGFDNSSVARLPFVQLTTMGHDPASLAATAVAAVIRRLDDPAASPVQHREPPHLVVRASTAPPRD